MLIYSQDKYTICNLENIPSVYVHKIPKSYDGMKESFEIRAYLYNYSNYTMLGEYKTEEKAMKVMDEIILFATALKSKVYEMPKDDGEISANWISISINFVSSVYKCSKCGREESFGKRCTELEVLEEYPYCSGCGSKMVKRG